ncbi:hypothetical protein L1987_66407 [Smallanthus sonchifolius]|uniref:Uncharacterized protein n=1 Tax=Smallanthus sonchifolius TaxID=185202 RepID=A0ACB9BXE1_9ASTR|nr:hypothetical protein L1987_66407 [Smallanthus sonchifolius]
MHSNLPPTMAIYIESSHLSWSYIFLALVLYMSCACEARGTKGGGFVRTKGSSFVINGSPFLFNGFNAYWMMNVASDPSERYKVVQVLQDAADAGLSVCRTWAFFDGVGDKALQISPGVYDERVFQGLDFVVAEARKYGLRLILSFVNSYKDFGGKLGRSDPWRR